MQSSQRAQALLIVGLLLGILMASSGVLMDETGELPEHAVARVNDHLILRDAWLRAVTAVASERRTPLTDEDKRHILDRLIDEELIAQHGVALGLVEQDRRLRGQLVAQVLQTATVANSGRVFSDDELRDFFGQHRDFFSTPARLRVSAVRIHVDGQRVSFVPPIPDRLLPPSKLRAYLGPSLTQAALRLRTGETSEPLPHGNGQVVLELLEREVGTPPSFEQVREQVSEEMARRTDENAVRQLLKQLREDNRVVVGDLP